MPNWSWTNATFKPRKRLSLDEFKAKVLDEQDNVSIGKLYGFDANKYLVCDATNMIFEGESDKKPMIGSEGAIFNKTDRIFEAGGIRTLDVERTKEREEETVNLLKAIGVDPKSEITRRQWTTIGNKLAKHFGMEINPFNWYGSNILLLGTKWAFQLEDLEQRDDGTITWRTETAWSEPAAFLQKLVNTFGGTLTVEVENEGDEWVHKGECEMDEEDEPTCYYESEEFGCHIVIHHGTYTEDQV